MNEYRVVITNDFMESDGYVCSDASIDAASSALRALLGEIFEEGLAEYFNRGGVDFSAWIVAAPRGSRLHDANVYPRSDELDFESDFAEFFVWISRGERGPQMAMHPRREFIAGLPVEWAGRRPDRISAL